MIISPSRAARARTPTPVRRLSATLYVYSFLDEFRLIYPVYALLFAGTGLSTAEISSLFVIWSVTGLLLEVPSGALADAVSRRLLLAVGPLLAGAGFALWVLAPSYWAFAVGFVLWGVQGALQSGALEALVYEELDHLDAADRYARVMGRARAAGLVAVMLAIAAAGPVFGAGNYLAVGAASVVGCLLTGLAGLAFPEHRSRHRADDGSPARPGGTDPTGPGDDDGGDAALGYLTTLRAGLAEVRRDRSVRAALLLVPAVTAIWGALDEYVPLLAGATGVPERVVPLLVLVVWAGVTVGGLLAGLGRRMTTPALGVLLALAALALAIGAVGHRPAGLLLVAAAFCVFQVASIVVDARLQHRITGPSRATVTSLAGLGTELGTIAVYGSYGAASTVAGHGTIFALLAVPYLVIAFALVRGDGRVVRRWRSPAR
jgi:MFS family permease